MEAIVAVCDCFGRFGRPGDCDGAVEAAAVPVEGVWV